MTTFASLLRDIRKAAYSEKDKGTRFERLINNYLQTSTKYAVQLKTVWLWDQFPYRGDFGGKDTGIDLVAKTYDGDYWAIQCKCYAEHTVINKPAVDSFLATSSRTFRDENGLTCRFAHRLWVATTEKWGINAREAMENQQPPVSMLNYFDIEADTTVDWDKLDAGISGKEAQDRVIHQPRSHQQKALFNAHEYYKTHDRGKLIMACGTGKTFTSLRLVEQETASKGLILVLVPSIALINQTLNEWDANSTHPIIPICVCSDSTASRKRNKGDDVRETPVDLASPACTDYKSVAHQIESACARAQHMVVVYSTYQSIEVISKAQKYLRGDLPDMEQALEDYQPDRHYDFDFIVCDEAHRTTGVNLTAQEASNFTKVHLNSAIAAKKRLYMTATPRIYADSAKSKAKENDAVVYSMDDEKTYGREFYRIGFGEAVERGLLADYKVLILTMMDDTYLPDSVYSDIQDKNKEINTTDGVRLVGCINALSKRVVPDPDIVRSVDPGLMHRAVAFCSNIAASKKISEQFDKYGSKILANFDEDVQDDTVLAVSRHIDGSMNAGRRNELIRWLKNAPAGGNECRILTNVRCLSEGVDVPSLDAVIFLSARNSQVDVVQSVGRVMRIAPGKKYGYIIIPIVMPAGADPNTVLDNNKDYGVIWTVLNALRAHDDRFNAMINKIQLNDERPTGPGGVIAGAGDGTYASGQTKTNLGKIAESYENILLFNDNVQNALYAKMVLKVGTKRYWEQWADDIAQIARRHVERIRRLIKENEDYKTGFEIYMDGLHKNINPNISEDTAVEMLAQHLITKPVFEALFENYSFADSNPISKAMKQLLDLVEETAYDKDQVMMKNFYKSVRERCEGIDNAGGRQKVIIELYDKFFKKALPQTVDKLGIVYTPVEVVDFINQSVAAVLKKEFNRSLSDENIHIIDPFTGTGTFITRLLQSGLIDKAALPGKYKSELHANEIVLLAYYIASINIENAYHDITGQQPGTYTPFDGICLTDTFQLYEDIGQDMRKYKYADIFDQNSERLISQLKAPMRVIIGNPPYSVGQKSANDNAKNDSYKRLEERIAKTYAAATDATNKNALYDSYIKAFRYAGDMLDDAGGVIGFVTNAGWLDGSAMDGLRKCFEDEFSSIYIYNLRGNQRTSGELSRREGGKIFGSGSRTPVAITILVKNPKAKNTKANIYYREVADYLSRDEKLAEIAKMKTVTASGFTQKVIHPNEAGDWLNQRSEIFGNMIPLGDKNNKENPYTVFVPYYSNGLKTQRDSWCYNYSLKILQNNIEESTAFYEQQRKLLGKGKIKEVEYDNKRISWSTNVLGAIKKDKTLDNKEEIYTVGMYRPFSKSNVFYSKFWNERRYQTPKIFPTPEHKNLIICVSGIGVTKDFSCIITDMLPDLELIGKSQCFPLYWYEEKKSSKYKPTLFDIADDKSTAEKKPEYKKHDGITDYILLKARRQYASDAITKEDIFYYVYGLLHSSQYRRQFAADLKKMLPRIVLVDNAADFKAFCKAGRALAKLHLDYEHQSKPDGVIVEYGAKVDYLVGDKKMKFKSKLDKSELRYNSSITIKNIPAEAYEYVVNGRSAIEWIIERYHITQDKKSLIVNNPNDWAKEHDDPQYILKLLLSIITVSIETVKIVRALPQVKFEGV